MDAYNVLVIILSGALAIFLVIGIVAMVAITKLINQIRRITAKADAVMDDVEAVSDFFRKSAAPVAITSLIGNIIANFTKHKK